MMALGSSRFVVRHCSACLVLLVIAAASSWVSPGHADVSKYRYKEPTSYIPKGTDAPISLPPPDLSSLPFHVILSGDIDQDNFRGGTVTWEPDPIVVNQVNFQIKACWTRSDFKGGSDMDGLPCPGDIVYPTPFTNADAFFFRDGPRFTNHTPPLFFVVTAIDKASDVMETIALCPTTRTGGTIRGSDPDHAPGNFDICPNNFEPPLDTTIRYRYEGTKNLPFGEPDHGPCDNGHEFDLSRLPAMKAGNRFQEQGIPGSMDPLLASNRGKPWRLGTWVTPCTGFRSPVPDLPPGCLIRLRADDIARFSIPVSPPDPGTHYLWRFTDGSDEAGSVFVRTPQWIRWANPIDPCCSLDGVLEANTTGVPDRTNWTLQVVCQELDDKLVETQSWTAIDFTIQIIDCGINGHTPAFDATATLGCGSSTTEVPPACGSTLSVVYNQQICFPVQASDGDGSEVYPGHPEKDQLYISASGLPAGATLDPPLPRTDNPVSAKFCWTPTCGDGGDHVVTFNVDDVCHPESCKVTIHVGPDCSAAQANLHSLPNNHQYYPINISGVSDPCGGPVTICVTGVTSDEKIAGGVCPDAIINGCSVSLAGERDPGSNGRVYIVSFTATDSHGGSCNGTVTVCVLSSNLQCIDDRGVGDVPAGGYDATPPCGTPTAPEIPRQVALGLNAVRVNGGLTTVEYSLPADGDVMIAVFDIAGRRMGTLVNSRQVAGSHQTRWNSGGLSRGIYYYRMQAAGRTLTRSVYIK